MQFLSYRQQGAKTVTGLIGDGATVMYEGQVWDAVITSVSPDGLAAVVKLTPAEGASPILLPDPHKVRPR